MAVGAVVLQTGCGGDGYTPELRAIDSMISAKPDSALRLVVVTADAGRIDFVVVVMMVMSVVVVPAAAGARAFGGMDVFVSFGHRSLLRFFLILVGGTLGFGVELQPQLPIPAAGA